MTTPFDAINPFSERVSDSVRDERMSICKACPEMLKFTTSCKKCGCFMNVKTRLAESECPLQKWGKYEAHK